MKSHAAQIPSISNRYVIRSVIGAGGMGTVYRAFDRLEQYDVALKQVMLSRKGLSLPDTIYFSTATPELDYRLALAQEFHALASLRHPNIISVLDYGFDTQRQPYFVMELLESAADILKVALQRNQDQRLNLIMQLTLAVAYLHRRGVIHRDLKPENVLVAGDRVKVLDFGLALVRGLESNPQEQVAGTLAYIAPEVLQGKPASEASDIYALGTMAYEILAGQHPFDASNISNLIPDIIHLMPDTSRIPAEPAIRASIERMMAKNPDDRPQDVNELLSLLTHILGIDQRKSLNRTRESFLQAARFVGRDAELNHFEDQLNATQDGSGSAWLIGGESGVGKSRILNELRILAQVRGMQTIRSQEISESNHPYQVWLPVLRWVCLQTEIDEAEASILKPIVPDIDKLLNMPVPDAPAVETPASRDRLFEVIESIFLRLHQPSLIILEDIHWASNGSLSILRRLSRVLERRPVLILASYRDDEQATLPARLPHMQTFQIQRLQRQGIAALSASMLGQAGQLAAVIDLLDRETEGNVYFMVEVVRALAEDAGKLELIGTKTLPSRVFAGGIEQVISRRLDRVSDTTRELLHLAALNGRQIDPNLMQALAKETDFDLNNWLTQCADAAVLSVSDGVWWFSHDKLREGLIARVEDFRRPSQHERIALALEQAYPQQADQASRLAYHWRKAAKPARELHYTTIAAEQALRSSAHQEAVSLFQRARQLLTMLGDYPEKKQQELDLLITMSAPLMATQGYASPLMREVSERARILCQQVGETPQLIRVLSILVAYYVASADYKTTHALAQQIHELGEKFASQTARIAGMVLMGQAAFFQGDFERARSLLEPAADVILNAKQKPRRPAFGQDTGVTGLIFLSATLWMLGEMSRSREVIQQAVQMAKALNHDFSLAFALNWAVSNSLYRRHIDDLFSYAQNAIEVSRSRSFSLFLPINIVMYNWALCMHLEASDRLCEAMRQSLQAFEQTGARFCVPFFKMLIAEVEAKLGHTDQALATLDQALAQIESSGEYWSVADLHRSRGEMRAKAGDHSGAEEAFEQSISFARKQGSKSLELRATTALLRMRQSQQALSREAVQDALANLLGAFERETEQPDVADARALLQAIS